MTAVALSSGSLRRGKSSAIEAEPDTSRDRIYGLSKFFGGRPYSGLVFSARITFPFGFVDDELGKFGGPKRKRCVAKVGVS